MTEAELTEHAPFLRALARRLATDAAVADDLVQDTWVAALGSRTAPATRLLPWLATVLRNRAARRMRGDSRRRRREQAAAAEPSSPDALTVATRLEVARRLLQHVEALDERSRDVVYLRFYQDQKPRQIAAALQLPLATIKTRLARALARLREQLDADDPQGRRNWLPALCAIGGLEPGALGSAAWLPRWLTSRNGMLMAVAVAVVTTTVVVGWPLRQLAAPSAPPSSTGAVSTVAAATEPTAGTPGVREVVDAAPSLARVHGVVEDADVGAAPGAGTPAAGVLVRYRLRQPSAVASPANEPDAAAAGRSGPLRAIAPHTIELETTTDAQGRFAIELPPHAELVLVEARGNEVLRAAQWWEASVLPDPFVLIRHLRTAFEGIVVEPSGAGVAHARVRLEHRQGREKVAVETTADGSGRFVFARVAADSWLSAERDGFVPVAATEPRVGARGEWEPGRIVLARSATLRVEFVDAEGNAARHVDGVGFGISEAEMGLLANLQFESPSRRWTPVARGRAQRVVPAGLQLFLWAADTKFVGERNGQAVPMEPGSPPASPLVLVAGEERTLRVVLGTDSEVHGTVLAPDGQPVAAADVSFQKVRNARLESIGMATTDARGHFALQVTGAGDREAIVVSARGSGTSSGLRATACLQVSGTAPMRPELRLAAPQELVGRVRDAEGRAVAARVRCQLAIPGITGWVGCVGERQTDAHGAFQIVPWLDTAHTASRSGATTMPR